MRIARLLLLLGTLALGACNGLETDSSDAAEEFLLGGPYGPNGGRVTQADCAERGDGDVFCDVTADTGRTTCSTNARDGTVEDVDCNSGERQRRGR